MIYYHGGKAGLEAGDLVIPSAPHVEDGCAICVARAEGRPFTVLALRAWALTLGDRGLPVLRLLEGAPPHAAIDPPTGKVAVYVTTDQAYASFYAARSGGDLYRVEPIGDIEPSPEDHFPAWTCASARVVEVLRRGVVRKRRERRQLDRDWREADRGRR